MEEHWENLDYGPEQSDGFETIGESNLGTPKQRENLFLLIIFYFWKLKPVNFFPEYFCGQYVQLFAAVIRRAQSPYSTQI